MINDHDISFVVQGPVIDTTIKTITSIKKHFPNSPIILSTWKGQDTNNLAVDRVIKNKDVGSTTIKYNKKGKPHTVNVNRQITSSINGLKAVDTPYAVKLRSDNVLNSKNILDYFDAFESHRETEYSLFNHRIVSSNYFAKEYTQGLLIPFFISDFFQFGETADLINLWDIELFSDYLFDEHLKGQLQHENLPFRQHHIEQKLWLKFINKKHNIELLDKFGDKLTRELSYKYLVNNVIILDSEQLALEVPKRLQQQNGFPYENFTHQRWHYLYLKNFNLDTSCSSWLLIKWNLAKGYQYLRKGWKSHLKGIKAKR